MKGAVVYVIGEETDVWETISSLTRSMGYRSERFATPVEFFKSYHDDGHGCLVSELYFPEMSGAELFRQDQHGCRLPIIFTSSAPDTPSVVEAMKRGAVTLLEHPLQENLLREAIREAMVLCESERSRRRDQQVFKQRYARLNDKERCVMELMVQGIANKVIAKKLGISVRTVESRRHDVFAKMEVQSLAALVRLVITART
jgi:FixJ family two-component response regulator